MGIEPVDWTGAWSLEDYVFAIFEKNGTQTLEFKVLLQIFGREKILKIWEKYQEMKKNSLKPP